MKQNKWLEKVGSMDDDVLCFEGEGKQKNVLPELWQRFDWVYAKGLQCLGPEAWRNINEKVKNLISDVP